MALLRTTDLRFAQILDEITLENPFSHRRRELERQALDAPTIPADPWALGPGHENDHLAPLVERADATLSGLAGKLEDPSEAELPLLGSLARFCLYYRFEPALHELRERTTRGELSRCVTPFDAFQREAERLIPNAALRVALLGDPAHLFAFAFQIRRAFSAIFERIIGASRPAADLRARVWESIFTSDQARYRRVMYSRMHEINTLISGPSGTGKELVADAIARSRYIAFDAQSKRFVGEIAGSFVALNLSALSTQLIESELFGHKRGSFTGASTDRTGFLESCPSHGTVFLDEIGEISPSLQVKLLRALQSRQFHRVGEEVPRQFTGKLVTATNRDLEREVEAGTCRPDFFHRLQGDRVTTPSLRSQLDDRPDDLLLLVANLASKMVGSEESGHLAAEVRVAIERDLPAAYPWPGNVRELEQCVRSVLVRGTYRPTTVSESDVAARLGRTIYEATLSFDALGDLYIGLAHRRYKNYSETARRLGLDRRTVKDRLNPELLADW